MCAEYEVVTVTGNARGAGTDANVFITMFGKTGQTPRLALNRSNFDNPFERSQSDVFLLKTKCVGPLNKIRSGLRLTTTMSVTIRLLKYSSLNVK